MSLGKSPLNNSSPSLGGGNSGLTHNVTGTAAPSRTRAAKPTRIDNLHNLVKEVDPNYVVHPDLEELLLEMADDFVEDVAEFACQIAKHRGSLSVELKDLQLALWQGWGIQIPGYPSASATVATAAAAAATGRSSQMHPLLKRKAKQAPPPEEEGARRSRRKR